MTWLAKMSKHLRFAEIASNRNGSVTVETALVLTFVLVPLTLGVIEVGRLLAAQVGLENATHTAMVHVLGADADGGAVAELAQQSPVPGLSFSTDTLCLCKKIKNPIACNNACNNGNGNFTPPVEHMQIEGTRPFTFLLPYPFVPSTLTLRAEVIIEPN